MKIYIFADMEGISGITGNDFVRAEGVNYSLGCEYFVQDINACVDACFEAGADEVIVKDGHGSGKNIILKNLDPRAQLIQGVTPNKRFYGIEGSAAVILLGYHAMAGTPNALLEHTYSSQAIQNMWLNGKLAGEFAFDALIAAEYGIPTIMVSGDDKICEEARSTVPDVVACQVKKAITCQSALLLSINDAHQLIKEKTIEAIGKIGEIKIATIDKPIIIRKEVVERSTLLEFAGGKIIDGRTVEMTTDNLEKGFFKIIF